MRMTTRFALAAGALLAAGSAQAAGITFDTTLVSPPGVYFGSGNPNTNWTADTESYGTGATVEVGLETITRFVGPITPDAGTSTYHVPTGNTLVAGHQGTNWGFPFSLNLNAGSVAGSATLGDVVTSLSISDGAHH